MSATLFCNWCGTRSMRMTGPAGDDAVAIQCGACEVVIIAPATPTMIARTAALFGRGLSDLLPEEEAARRG